MDIEVKNQLDLSDIEGLSDEVKAKIAEKYNATVIKEIEPLKLKNSELIGRETDAKKKADDEAAAALELRQKQELDKATNDKDVKSLLEVIERHKQENADLKGSIAKRDKDQAVGKLVTDFNGQVIDDPAAKDYLSRKFKSRLDHRDGAVVVLTEDGGLSGISPNELAQNILNDKANAKYVRANVGSGGSANGSNGSGSAANSKTMTMSEWAKLQETDPAAARDAATKGQIIDD